MVGRQMPIIGYQPSVFQPTPRRPARNIQSRDLMEQDVLRTNLLSIVGAGFLMLLAGTFLYFYRDNLSANYRFFMPLPPLAVAAYIYVFNMFGHYSGELPNGFWVTMKEILISIAVTSTSFGIFVILLIAIISFFRQ